MKNFKRLFKLMKGRYRFFVTSISMILIVQILGFVSPLLVKSVLDDCLLGVDYPWVEIINDSSEETVSFENRYYKQERHLKGNETIINEASVVVIGKNYYLVNERIEEGSKEIENDKLKITCENGIRYYDITSIPKTMVSNFYNPIITTLFLLLGLIALKTILSIVCSYIQQICTNKVINNLARDGRTSAMKSVERLPLSEFEKEPAGKTASRITTDVDGIIILYRLVVNVFLNALLSFIFAYVGMFILDTKLAILSFVIYPIAYIWIRFFLKHLKKIATKVNESRSLLTAKINEIINGIQILQIFNFKKQTVQEFDEISETYKNEQLKEVKLHITGGWNLINVLKAIITVAIVSFFGFQRLNVYGVVITAGLIYAYNEYLLKIIEPINILLNQVGQFQHAHVQMDRIFTLIDADLESYEKHDIPRYTGKITFDDVTFSYINDENVLRNVSFEIEPGTMVGLVGYTGSGKSSLMNLLLRFYDLDKNGKHGKIYLDDEPITKYSKRTYRNNIGIVLQEPVLFRGTIASNIRFGKENVSDEKIIDVLKEMGGEKLMAKFKEGINQPITRQGNNMSAGEKQIISLARAIIQDPSILIMDEATSHIDIETETIIKKGLAIACKNRTVIVIAHRLSTIYEADKIIVLENGLKVEEGKHEELIKANGVYANIYRAQIQIKNN